MKKPLPFYNKETRKLIKEIEEEANYLFSLIDDYIEDNNDKLDYLLRLEEDLKNGR